MLTFQIGLNMAFQLFLDADAVNLENSNRLAFLNCLDVGLLLLDHLECFFEVVAGDGGQDLLSDLFVLDDFESFFKVVERLLNLLVNVPNVVLDKLFGILNFGVHANNV